MKLNQWIDSLNEEQKAVVLEEPGISVVYAGAGTGKTRTLTLRLAYLIHQGVRPYEILGITFTNKAANELQNRVVDLVGDQGKKVLISTFHGLCTHLFRIHHEQLGLNKNFLIYSESDQVREMRLIVKSFGDQPPLKVDQLVSALNDLRCKGLSFLGPSSSVQKEVEERFLTPLQKEFAWSCFQQYEKGLQSKNAYDFGRLLTFLLDSLKKNQAYAQELSKRFRFVFVDEFQDTNLVQLELIKILAHQHKSICVVGDDDQSIYSWRGATPDCFDLFCSWYPQVRRTSLERNYRSTPLILNQANALIQHNVQRHPKLLKPSLPQTGWVKVVEAHNRSDEAFWVAHQIRDLKKKYQLNYEDFAILFRMNYLSKTCEQACLTLDIPYHLATGQKLFDLYETSLLMAYLRVLFNPQDDTAFLETLTFPRKGWGEKSLLTLRQTAESFGETCVDWCQNLLQGSRTFPGRLTKSALKNLDDHLQFFKKLKEAQLKGRSIKDLLKLILAQTNYQEALEKAYKFDSVRRWSNVLSAVDLAEKFDEQVDGAEEDYLELFLTQQSLDSSKEEEIQGVQLLTIHGAKGLEWPCVFVIGGEEGILPLASKRLDPSADNRHLEEERRLCYVALTRAQKFLYLTYTQLDETRYDPADQSRQKSRFLEEMQAFERLPFVQTPQAQDYREPFSFRGSLGKKVKNEFGKEKPLLRTADDLLSHGEEASFQVGQVVHHALFGAGRVLELEGQGAHTKVSVQFEKGDEKKILGRFLESSSV